MTARSLQLKKGFTLIELLVVIGILAVLLAITLIAINPAKQFAQANNTKRRGDISAILNAVNQFQSDNKGTLPTGIDTTLRTITNDASITDRADLCAQLVTKYLAALPTDPKGPDAGVQADCSGTYNTGYTIQQLAADNRVTVTAPLVELAGETASVTR